MNRWTLLACAALLVCSGCSATKKTKNTGQYGPVKGESELSFGGNFTKTDSDGFTDQTIAVQVGAGILLSNSLEFGGQAIAGYSKSETSGFGPSTESTSTNIGLLPYFRWNFRLSHRAWLYLGPHFGVVQFDDGTFDESVFSYGGHAGFKVWVNPRTSLFIEPRFTSYSIETAGGAAEVDIDQTDVLVGLTVFL